MFRRAVAAKPGFRDGMAAAFIALPETGIHIHDSTVIIEKKDRRKRPDKSFRGTPAAAGKVQAWLS